MKKNIKNIATILLLIFIATSCDDFDFDKEVYKSVVYLLSDQDEFNLYNRSIADLNKEIDTLYITVGVSGSTDTPNDIPVILSPYYIDQRVDSVMFDKLNKDRLFYQYNKSRFDIDFNKWGSFLPESHYDFLDKNKDGSGTSGFVNLKTVIPQGNNKVTIPVIVNNLSMLSPDSTYYMDYQIESAGNTEINNKKNNVLIPVYWKNDWTNTKNPLSYDMFGEQFTWTIGAAEPVFGTERIITGSPILFPLSKNEIRIAAGILSIDGDENNNITAQEQIDNHSIILKVNEDNTVDIRSYKNLIVEQVSTDDKFYYPEYGDINTYFIEERLTTTGISKYFKTFNLFYRYRLLKDNKNPFKKYQWVYIKCKISYEFQPQTELN